ncbi:MAG: ribonuclease P protein component [Lachnospiraceae bacterium]|nr:ribonuclease P protein component [Lachnospiraceae bacterium]
MKNFNSIKKNSDFQNVYNKGKSYANKQLVMYVLDNNMKNSRIGISVSKKVGNSIVRHRITRLIRECYRLNEDKLERNIDIVVVVRIQAKEAGFHEIMKSYLHLCNLHKILKEMV